MKKIMVLASVCSCLLFSSCYTSRVAHGDMSSNTPKVQVNSKKNQILLWGLLPLNSDQVAKDYVSNNKNYVTETSWTFVDGLLNCITFGIYSPTTTTYYLPMNQGK